MTEVNLHHLNHHPRPGDFNPREIGKSHRSSRPKDSTGTHRPRRKSSTGRLVARIRSAEPPCSPQASASRPTPLSSNGSRMLRSSGIGTLNSPRAKMDTRSHEDSKRSVNKGSDSELEDDLTPNPSPLCESRLGRPSRIDLDPENGSSHPPNTLPRMTRHGKRKSLEQEATHTSPGFRRLRNATSDQMRPTSTPPDRLRPRRSSAKYMSPARHPRAVRTNQVSGGSTVNATSVTPIHKNGKEKVPANQIGRSVGTETSSTLRRSDSLKRKRASVDI